jgi:hypothetical protein
MLNSVARTTRHCWYVPEGPSSSLPNLGKVNARVRSVRIVGREVARLSDGIHPLQNTTTVKRDGEQPPILKIPRLGTASQRTPIEHKPTARAMDTRTPDTRTRPGRLRAGRSVPGAEPSRACCRYCRLRQSGRRPRTWGDRGRTAPRRQAEQTCTPGQHRRLAKP